MLKLILYLCLQAISLLLLGSVFAASWQYEHNPTFSSFETFIFRISWLILMEVLIAQR